MTTPLYDTLSVNYDRFVNWDARLEAEMPFLTEQLSRFDVQRVLDVACGTGQHALALAEHGYPVTGVDVSERMIDEARENAAQAGQDVRFLVAGFGELAARLASQTAGGFDALLCLGNSLPHIPGPEALAPTLRDFAQVLGPEGFLLVQNRNFDQVLEEQERWMSPQSYRQGEREWIFVRFYDWLADQHIRFNMLTLYRQGTDAWQQQADSTLLWPLRRAEMESALAEAGFKAIEYWGNMEGAAYDPATSSNLVVGAQRA